jgi:hypothetical protein
MSREKLKELPQQAPVELRPEWANFLGGLSGKPRIGAPARPWTEEEDAFLLAARERGARWLDIAERVGCSQDTARKRWRELTGS